MRFFFLLPSLLFLALTVSSCGGNSSTEDTDSTYTPSDTTAPTLAEITAVSTSAGTYQTSKFGGSTFYGLVGTQWGGVEGWLGYEAITLQYADFQQGDTTLGKPLAVSLGLLVFGIGGSF